MAQAILRETHQSELCAGTSKGTLHGRHALAFVHDQPAVRFSATAAARRAASSLSQTGNQPARHPVTGWRGRRFFVGTQPIGARSIKPPFQSTRVADQNRLSLDLQPVTKTGAALFLSCGAELSDWRVSSNIWSPNLSSHLLYYQDWPSRVPGVTV
jgi:hypothetical protein